MGFVNQHKTTNMTFGWNYILNITPNRCTQSSQQTLVLQMPFECLRKSLGPQNPSPKGPQGPISSIWGIFTQVGNVFFTHVLRILEKIYDLQWSSLIPSISHHFPGPRSAPADPAPAAPGALAPKPGRHCFFPKTGEEKKHNWIVPNTYDVFSKINGSIKLLILYEVRSWFRCFVYLCS